MTIARPSTTKLNLQIDFSKGQLPTKGSITRRVYERVRKFLLYGDPKYVEES